MVPCGTASLKSDFKSEQMITKKSIYNLLVHPLQQEEELNLSQSSKRAEQARKNQKLCICC